MTDLAGYIRALQGPIIVTGASGFIGANLFHRIRAVRDDVHACVKRDKGWRLAEVPDEHVIEADLTDVAETRNLVAALAPRTVFDCVAYGAYPFEQDFRLIYQTNLQSVVNLVTELRDRPFAAYVHAGSSSEYGSNSAGPAESDPCVPDSDYAVSKMAASGYLRFSGKHRAFPCVNLRLYSVYGPLEDRSRMVPALVTAALAGGYPPATFPARPKDGLFIDKHDVLAATTESDTVIVNALGPQFYKGLEPSRYGRPGRIPGSVSVPAASLIDAKHKTFVPLEEAEATFAAQGITKDKRVIAYCGGGISATIDLFQLHRLGYDNLTLYDGSMGEWAKDAALPIEVG
jgi:rhodanese-related sulfurtransferase